MLKVEGLCKSFGRTAVLKDLSFQVSAGQSHVVIGPSGCGKSTLIRLLCGLDSPDSGRIAHEGQSLLRLPPHARGISVCFQSSALWPHMTLRQNIEAAAPKGSDHTVNELLDRLDLIQVADRRPSEVSGGQARRAALARALTPPRPLILLDEPLSSLGGQVAEQTAALINEITQVRGQSVIWTAHTLDTPLIRFDRSLELSRVSG